MKCSAPFQEFLEEDFRIDQGYKCGNYRNYMDSCEIQFQDTSKSASNKVGKIYASLRSVLSTASSATVFNYLYVFVIVATSTS